MLPHGRSVRAIFVDVVAVVEDEAQLLFGEMAVGCVISRLIVLAACDSEAKPRRRGSAARKGSRVAGAAALTRGRKAVEIRAVGLQARNLDMHRMGELRPRRRF